MPANILSFLIIDKMNVVGYDDMDEEENHSIDSEITAVSHSTEGPSPDDEFVPPFRLLPHTRENEPQMEERINNFYDGLENSGESWQDFFDEYRENLPSNDDYIDGLVDSPFPAWDSFWNNFIDDLYEETPFWGVHPPELVRPTAEWIWDRSPPVRSWTSFFSAVHPHDGPLWNANDEVEEGEGWARSEIPKRFL
jgi:hypothetical protein